MTWQCFNEERRNEFHGDETFLERIPTLYWVLDLNAYETLEWNFALRVKGLGFRVLELNAYES